MLAVTLAASTTAARAHEIVGNRLFPATLAIDDPGVTDELALPTISMSKTGDDPSFKQLDVWAEFAKRITEDFAVSVAPAWSRLYAPGGLTMNGVRGFQNLETLFKYRLVKNAEHEFVMSVGLEIEWGGSGAQGVGAERFNVYAPTVFFGKGFGDLPATLNWAWPFALPVVRVIRFPVKSLSRSTDTQQQEVINRTHPARLQLGRHIAIQHAVSVIGSGRSGAAYFINRLILIVEASLQTPKVPIRQRRESLRRTINPGIILTGKTTKWRSRR